MKNILFSLRMLKRNKMLTYVGIPSLAIGLTVVLLLVSYLKRELSFDEHFTTKNRVVRLLNTATEGETGTYPICLRKSYTEIPLKVAEIEASTQLYRGWKTTISVNDRDDKYRAGLLFADPEFFKVFDQKMIMGDPSTALTGKNKVVLSERLAKKIFGSVDCIGKSIDFEFIGSTNYIVNGVVKDIPKNTHFQYDMLASMETLPIESMGGLEFFTYFLIRDNADIQLATNKIIEANDELMKPWKKAVGIGNISETELLKDIKYTKAMFDISHQSNMFVIWVVGIVVLFVLVISLVNFINLYTLHSSRRIGEVAMRKSLGATPANLARLFFTDTTIMAVIAFVIAIFLASFTAPYFSKLLYSKVTLLQLLDPLGVGIIIFLLLLIIISSATNSLYSVARTNLAIGVKGKTDKVRRKSYATQVALLLQFSITAFLIVGVSIFYSQIRHIKNIPLGFDEQNVSVIQGFNNKISQKIPSITNELQKLPFIEDVTSSQHRMGGGSSGQSITKYGSTDKPIPINEYRIQSNFCQTMKIEFLTGNGFSKDKGQSTNVILNETAVKRLQLENPVGKQVVLFNDPMMVIGVVKDFYYESNAGQSVQPLVLTNYSPRSNVIYIRTKTEINLTEREQIEGVFKQFDNSYTLQTYSLDSVYYDLFATEDRAMFVMSCGALLAILLSISGLVAMSFLSVNRRTKEIGVRKVMGSSEKQILYMLVKQTLIWVAIASCIGFLASYIVMQEVMQNFANRIDISFVYFLFSAFIVLAISLLSVGWQSWKASCQNPVEALRYE